MTDRWCEKTGKRCFKSKREARSGMKNIHRRLRAYRCQHCKLWHMTSQTERKGVDR